MANITIAYASEEGQTAKIAQRMAGFLREQGQEITTIDGRELSTDSVAGDIDAIIIGASIHRGKHPRYLRDWVRDNLTLLGKVPSAFFSVSLSAADPKPEGLLAAQQCANAFLQETGWQPDKTALFAGALMYTRYGLIKRLLMKMIASKAGGATDTSRDAEYTDWAAVTRFAQDFSMFCMDEIETQLH